MIDDIGIGMRIIKTNEIDPFLLKGFERDMCYNGYDVCGTAEILPPMLSQLDDVTSATYRFERELQGPVLEMGLRGCLIDQTRKAQVIDEFWEALEILERDLNRIVVEGVGMHDFNWRSNPDRQRLFYTELGLPVIRKQGRPTTDDDALDELEAYPIATQIVKHMRMMSELGKKLSVLRTEIDDDGRIRTSYNIAGTSTGRFSSSLSEFGTGGNLQNVEESLRSIFIADAGFKFAKFDAKSCQSQIVGAICWNLFRDSTYLDAVESGDVHTAVARLVWPNMGWTGDQRRDKHLAETPFYRHYTHRFMCKKIGHGSNFGGEPPAIALETKLPINIIAEFQPKYFEAFPAIKQRFDWTRNELKTKRRLISIGGRIRYFFKRPSDKKLLKEALAYDPQETESFVVNTAMLNIWKLTKSDHPLLKNVSLIFQDHDALTFTYPERDEDRIIPLIQQNLPIPIPLKHGRTLTIPYDVEVGWNKGKYCCGELKEECIKRGCPGKANRDGLREYDGSDNRRRGSQISIMDRVVHRSNGKPRRTIDLSSLVRNLGAGRNRDAESMGEDEFEPAS